MKRHLTTMTLLALLLAAAGTLKAQQAVEFAPVGAEWYYERLYREGWNLNGITYDRFRSLRTVEINGWECREIELYQHLDCYGVPNPNYEIRYVTQEGDRVYEVEDGQRFLLYDFGKGPGESWYAPKYQTTVTVHRVDSMTMNDNTVRKVLVTEPSNNWDFFYIIEGVGTRNSLFPVVFGMVGTPCANGPIRCYSENGISLIDSQEACEFEVLAVKERSEVLLQVSPSPATGSATVAYSLPNGCGQAVLELTNVLGVEVAAVTLEGDEGSATLDLGGLAPGIYLYTVRCGGRTQTGKLAVTR